MPMVIELYYLKPWIVPENFMLDMSRWKNCEEFVEAIKYMIMNSISIKLPIAPYKTQK